jgi:hypothetical protein
MATQSRPPHPPVGPEPDEIEAAPPCAQAGLADLGHFGPHTQNPEGAILLIVTVRSAVFRQE